MVLVWPQDPNYSNYSNQLQNDLDLHVYDESVYPRRWVAVSWSWDNTYEYVDFVPTRTGTYTVWAMPYRCEQGYNWLGLAWHQAP